MKVFVYSAHGYDTPFLKKAAEGKHELYATDQKLTFETAGLAAGCEAVALFTADDASEKVLQKLYNLGVRYIALRSAGYDHVCIPKAEKLGLKVANVPAYSPYAIAEHAVAMLLAFNRKIVEAQALINLHDFRLDTLTGFDLHGKTVGIIGTGTIGLAFAAIMKGFGMRIIAFDPVQRMDAMSMGVRYVDLDELFRKSDVISLHCPLNEKTRHLISKPQLDMMKPSAIIINTARGAVINTADLLDAIEQNRIAGACLDVYENEKSIFFQDNRNRQIADPLFSRLKMNNKVLITGHQAFLTAEALTGIAETTMRNLDCWEDGEAAPNELTRIAAGLALTQ